jgi:hypothetical protein
LILVCMIASNTWKICMILFTNLSHYHILSFFYIHVHMHFEISPCINGLWISVWNISHRIFNCVMQDKNVVSSPHPTTAIVVVTRLQFSKLERIWIKISSNSTRHLVKSTQTWLARPQTTFCNCPVQSC